MTGVQTCALPISAPNSNELPGFKGTIDQAITPRGSAADDPFELSFGQYLFPESFLDEPFSESLHRIIIPYTSEFRKFMEIL